MKSRPIDYRALVEALPHLIYVLCEDGEVEYVSPRWLDYVRPEEGRDLRAIWREAVHPDEVDHSLAAFWSAVRLRTPLEMRYRLRRHDGVYRWFAATMVPISTADGATHRWLGSLSDVHEQHVLAEEVARRDAIHSRIAATTPSMLHSYRRLPDGRPVFPYISSRMAEFFEVDPADVARDGHAIIEMTHEGDRALVIQAVEESARTMLPWHIEYRIRHPSRGVVWIDGHSMPLRDDDEEVVWHGSLTDVTERRLRELATERENVELEARVRARTAELEQLNRELEAFAYSISHDLRAPLRTLAGFTRALEEDHGGTMSVDAQRLVTIIRDGAGRMRELIDDLLAFSRLSRAPVVREDIDMRLLVDECILALVSSGPAHAIVRVDALPHASGDRTLLRQVWMNLLSNALKYSRRREVPEIRVTFDQAEGLYRVADNGTGFDMAYAHKLFRVFQRLHRDEEFEGTGVGLAIVQRIVHRHGGRVTVDATPGVGATFSFSIGPAR